MGAEGSKCPVEGGRQSLADKRYKVEPPRRKAHSIGHSPPHAGGHGSRRDSSLTPPRSSDDQSPEEDSNYSLQPQHKMSTVSEQSFDSKMDFEARHFLPRRERILIVKSWRKTQKTGADHVGTKIFLRVLTTAPDIKAIFGLEKIPQGRLKYDPRFRQHAVVYTKTLDYVVKNLEYADKLKQHFDNLGRRHVGFQGRGFDPSYWEVFAECMTQTAAEWDQHRHRPTTSAWRSLISCIVQFMRRGYDDDMAKKRAMYPRTVGASNLRKISSFASGACPVSSSYAAYHTGENEPPAMCPAHVH